MSSASPGRGGRPFRLPPTVSFCENETSDQHDCDNSVCTNAQGMHTHTTSCTMQNNATRLSKASSKGTA